MTPSRLRIVVGITGGIAAYKAVGLVRALVLEGHHVEVIATDAALQFVGRPTLEAISRNPVYVGLYDDVAQVRHVSLGQQADVVVIAPATANTLANIAHGNAPDLLGNTVLARRGPLVVAPAMHTEMWENPATMANIKLLRERGVVIVGPGIGALTGADSGIGRMADVDEIVEAVHSVVHQVERDLVGKRILISAGGTREPIDPVRFIGNRSSGAMAAGLAQAALNRGATVTVVASNVEVELPAGVRIVSAPTALDMHREMMNLADDNDVVIMAAAVADYRPSVVATGKLKKAMWGSTPRIELVQNADVLSELGSREHNYTLVGFAAETVESDEEFVAEARHKLESKGCDMLVANRVGVEQGFGDVATSVTVLRKGTDIIETSAGSKASVAASILQAIIPVPTSP